MKQEIDPKVGSWISFIGLVLILVGIYGLARTVVNLTLFEKYPTSGVVAINFSGIPAYEQREEDCAYSSYFPTDATVVGSDGQSVKVDQPTPEESQDNCIKGINESRERAKVNDLSNSLLLLFLGAGVLFARKNLLR